MTRAEFLEKAILVSEKVVDGVRYVDYNDCVRKIDKSDVIKDGKQILEFLKEFALIHIVIKSSRNNDYKNVRISTGAIHYWADINVAVVGVTSMWNTSLNENYFYMSEEGVFYNQERNVIAYNTDDYLKYLLNVKCDYHKPISEKTYHMLKEAGWYEGRCIDISELVSECENDGIFLSEMQKKIIMEFGGIKGKDKRNREFRIKDKKEWLFYEKLFPYDSLTTTYGTDLVCIGDYADQMIGLYLTTDGRLVNQMGLKLGLDIMESFNILLGDW